MTEEYMQKKWGELEATRALEIQCQEYAEGYWKPGKADSAIV
jgi:hypothetical protein